MADYSLERIREYKNKVRRQSHPMNYRYRWKNGAPPSRDQAARSEYLLDKDQFDNETDRVMAEQDARKYLNVPLQTLDADIPVLPEAAPPPSIDNL